MRYTVHIYISIAISACHQFLYDVVVLTAIPIFFECLDVVDAMCPDTCATANRFHKYREIDFASGKCLFEYINVVKCKRSAYAL